LQRRVRSVVQPVMRFPAIHKILIIYTYLGIDFGTSSVKVVVFAVEAVIKGIGLAEYPILTPRIGYAEQDLEQWWRATITAVKFQQRYEKRHGSLSKPFFAKGLC